MKTCTLAADFLARLFFIAALISGLWLICRLVYSAEKNPPPICPALRSPRLAGLDELAQAHAESMACRCQQDHAGFATRAALAKTLTGCRLAVEICAETWPWQSSASTAEQWEEYVRCWQQSPGHWSVARVKHRFIGIGSAKGKNGIWYGCLLAVDE